jgi:hydrogenase maturation protease
MNVDMSTQPCPPAPYLVLGWGNPSRGDDALGPLAVQQLRQAWAAREDVDYLDDYQLQPEHALDLMGRRGVLFIDASLNAAAPFEASTPQPVRDASFSTHALSPAALLQVYRDLQGQAPPPCTLLAIRGHGFALGAAPSAQALVHLQAAVQWAQTHWINPKAMP